MWIALIYSSGFIKWIRGLIEYTSVCSLSLVSVFSFFFIFHLAVPPSSSLTLTVKSGTVVHQRHAYSSLTNTPVSPECVHWTIYFGATSFSSSIHQGRPLSGRHDSLTLTDHSHGRMVNSYNLPYEFVLIIGFLPLFICSPPSCFLLLLLR